MKAPNNKEKANEIKFVPINILKQPADAAYAKVRCRWFIFLV